MTISDKTNSVSLTWQEYRGDPAQLVSYILEYRKKVLPANQESQIIVKDDSIATNGKEVTGLTAGTEYQVRVSVKTVDFGYSPPSNWMNFQTRDTSTSDQNAMENKLNEIVSKLANRVITYLRFIEYCMQIMFFQVEDLKSYAKIDSITSTYATKSSVDNCATQTSLATLEVSTN